MCLPLPTSIARDDNREVQIAAEDERHVIQNALRYLRVDRLVHQCDVRVRRLAPTAAQIDTNTRARPQRRRELKLPQHSPFLGQDTEAHTPEQLVDGQAQMLYIVSKKSWYEVEGGEGSVAVPGFSKLI